MLCNNNNDNGRLTAEHCVCMRVCVVVAGLSVLHIVRMLCYDVSLCCAML